MKHKLKPFKEKEEKVCSTARICFSNGKDFFKDMRCEHVYFSVVLKYCKDDAGPHTTTTSSQPISQQHGERDDKMLHLKQRA